MKKFVAFIVVSFLLLSACEVPRDEVLLSLGKYSSKEYFSSGGVQDYTDYAKYTFDSINLEDNQYFEEIDHLNYNDLVVHIDNFEQWIGAIEETDPENEVVAGYDFDISVITDDDYIYICDDPDYPELGNYEVYFIDMNTKVLYFFHNNI